MSLMLALALTVTPNALPIDDDAWLQCARSAIERQLDQGTPREWPKVDSVPQSGFRTVALASRPSAEASDALHYVLHGVPGTDVVYLSRSGGIGDFRVTYGPVSLRGRCERLARAD